MSGEIWYLSKILGNLPQKMTADCNQAPAWECSLLRLSPWLQHSHEW